MPAFAFDEAERDDMSDEAATALLLAAVGVRKRIAANLTGPLPDNPSDVYTPGWWDAAVADDVTDRFRSIAADAVDAAADRMGATLDATDRAAIIDAVTLSASELVTHRGVVVDERVAALMQTAAAEGRDGPWVAEQLGITDDDDSGPLSVAVLTAIGVSIGLAIADDAAEHVATYAVGTGTHVGTKTWNTVGDHRVRLMHRLADGQERPVGEPFNVGGFPGMYPHDPALPIGLTANCLPGDVEVSGLCTSVIRGPDRDRDLYEFVTTGGKKLAATADHPILTRRGWIPFESLQPGDYVLCAAQPRSLAVAGDDPTDRPSTIEEAYASVPIAGSRFERTDVVMVDLDGQVVDREVHVKGTNHPFTVGDYSIEVEQLGHFPIAVSASEVCGAGDTTPFIGVRHANQCGLVASADREVEVPQTTVNDVAADPEFLRDGLDRAVGRIHRRNPVVVDHAAFACCGANGDVVSFQAPVDEIDTDIQLAADPPGTSPSLVFSDDPAFEFQRVTTIRTFPHCGPVYNLETRSGLYMANGVVVHNCRCWCTYEMAGVVDETEMADADVLEFDDMDDLSVAASVSPIVERTYPNGGFRGTKAMARRFTIATHPDGLSGVVAAAGVPDYTDGIAVTVEPTAAEKLMLAVPGGLPPAEIHCTLAYLGTTAELDGDARMVVSGVLASVAATHAPFGGEVAGIGWFGAPDAISLALVDGDGLAAFRTELVAALVAAGIPVSVDHDFIPHVTLAYSASADAPSRAGMPLHFNELRCRWGTEVLVADLLGGDVPPLPVPDEPAEPPVTVTEPGDTVTEPNATEPVVTAVTHGGVTRTFDPPVPLSNAAAAFADVVDPVDMPVDPDDETEPADPGELPDDALIAEVARRAANAAVELAGVDTDLSNDDVAAIHAAAEENATAMYEQLVESAAGEAGDDVDDGDWETSPDGAGTGIPLGGQEGYTMATSVTGFASGGVIPAGATIAPGHVAQPSDPFAGMWHMVADPSVFATGAPPMAPAPIGVTDHKGTAFAVEGIRPAPEISEFEWEGPITVEGLPSGDSRMFAEGSLDWRQLPVPMAFLDKITSEHQEGELAGWAHRIERRDGGAIWAYGTYAPTPAADRMRTILADPNGPGRYGVSVDVDSVTAVYATSDGTIMDPMEAQEAYYAGEAVMMMMTAGRISGFTAVLHPAFMEAQVWNVGPTAEAAPMGIAASGGTMCDTWRSVQPCALRPYVAGVAASAGDVAASTTVDITAPPPAAWFELDNELLATMVASRERGAFDVMAPDAAGRIRLFGIVAPPNECHIGIADRCQLMPRSRDFSRFYATGQPDDPWRDLYSGATFDRFYADAKAVICEGGERVVVGPLILDNVHPNLRMRASDTQPFYAHTGSAVGDVRLHMTPHGLVAAGAVRPGVSWIDVYKVRASSVSPDWRPINGENKVQALLAVNVSGFQLAVAASGGVSWEDAIVETQERVGALVASAGVATARRRDRERLDALESEVVRLRAGIEPIIVRTESEARAALSSAALLRMGVEPTRRRTAAALASMGIGAPDPCGCGES